MIPSSILLRTINVSDRRTDDRNAYLVFNNDFFYLENRAVSEIMRRNVVQPDGRATDDDIEWCMRFACWITKATNTHSQ